LKLTLRPATLRETNAWIDKHHSHHKPSKGHRWSIALENDGQLCAVALVSTPRAPELSKNPRILEVARTCTDGTKHAASKVLAAAARACLAMGCVRVVTYTRADETGVSVRAAGFRPVARVDGREWTSGNKKTRWLPGLYVPTTAIVDRIRWERGPEAAPEFFLRKDRRVIE
jgi:hypothetical protein